MLRNTLMAGVMLAALSAHAYANDQKGGSGHSANAGLTGGATGGAAAASAHSTASAVTGPVRATGGNGGAGGAGGRGGNATGGTARGGTSNVSVNNTLGGGGGGSSGGGGRAPDVFLPSIGGGGMDCPTVGFGAAGSGLGGGGGFGPSWISSKCDARRTVDLLANVFGPAVAREYAIQNIAGVKEAVASATQGRPMYLHPAWCRTNGGVWLRDLDECGEEP